QVPVPDRHSDALPGVLSRLRIDAAPAPHLGLRITVATADDTDGLMMKLDPVTEPAGEGGTGAPISLFFEWVTDPYGTFFKVLSKKY
ncbi:MAG: hypothetical protein ACRDJE_06240, partial [Dehalococcoidia bacterium]